MPRAVAAVRRREGAMAPIVLAVLVIVALVIAVDTARQRRLRATRTIDLRGLVTARLVGSTRPLLREGLARALAAPPTVATDVYESLSHSLEVAELRPRLRDGCELKVFRLRWGNDYAMLARDDREMHYRLEVWEAELLPKLDGTRTVGELVVERMEAGAGLDAEPVTDLVIALYAGGFLDPAPIATDDLIA